SVQLGVAEKMAPQCPVLSPCALADAGSQTVSRNTRTHARATIAAADGRRGEHTVMYTSKEHAEGWGRFVVTHCGARDATPAMSKFIGMNQCSKQDPSPVCVQSRENLQQPVGQRRPDGGAQAAAIVPGDGTPPECAFEHVAA